MMSMRHRIRFLVNDTQFQKVIPIKYRNVYHLRLASKKNFNWSTVDLQLLLRLRLNANILIKYNAIFEKHMHVQWHCGTRYFPWTLTSSKERFCRRSDHISSTNTRIATKLNILTCKSYCFVFVLHLRWYLWISTAIIQFYLNVLQTPNCSCAC